MSNKIFSQLNIGGEPTSWKNEEVNREIGSEIPTCSASYIDWQKVKEEDIKNSLS